MALCSFFSRSRTVLFITRILRSLLGFSDQINQLVTGMRIRMMMTITMVLRVFIGYEI
jgi:hypothetical protein